MSPLWLLALVPFLLSSRRRSSAGLAGGTPRLRPPGVDAKAWARHIDRCTRVVLHADPRLTRAEANTRVRKKLAEDPNAYGPLDSGKRLITEPRPPNIATAALWKRLVNRGVGIERARDPSLTFTEASQRARANLTINADHYGVGDPQTHPIPAGLTPKEMSRAVSQLARDMLRVEGAPSTSKHRRAVESEARKRLHADPALAVEMARRSAPRVTLYTGRRASLVRQKRWEALAQTTRDRYTRHLRELYGTSEPSLERIREGCPQTQGRTHQAVQDLRSALYAWLRHLGVGAAERREIGLTCLSDVTKAGQRLNPKRYGDGIL